MKASAAPRPPTPVVKDKIDHWPIWDDRRNLCKMENCKGITNVKCSKCNLNMCFHAKKTVLGLTIHELIDKIQIM